VVTLKILVFLKLTWVLPVEEFLYSDEYCGGIANGKRLKAVVAGGSSVPILPANLFMKTITGEPRLMSYESLADGGFVSGTMMGSGGLSLLMKINVLYAIPGTLPVFIIMKAADNVHLAVKVPDGWKKFCTAWNTVMVK
jgi:NADH:ubiquinone oxidoreductase subunit F (NADH-binding)